MTQVVSSVGQTEHVSSRHQSVCTLIGVENGLRDLSTSCSCWPLLSSLIYWNGIWGTKEFCHDSNGNFDNFDNFCVPREAKVAFVKNSQTHATFS